MNYDQVVAVFQCLLLLTFIPNVIIIIQNVQIAAFSFFFFFFVSIVLLRLVYFYVIIFNGFSVSMLCPYESGCVFAYRPEKRFVAFYCLSMIFFSSFFFISRRFVVERWMTRSFCFLRFSYLTHFA